MRKVAICTSDLSRCRSSQVAEAVAVAATTASALLVEHRPRRQHNRHLRAIMLRRWLWMPARCCRSSSSPDFNLAFATVVVCSPGTSNCVTIDHVQVDTGSTGLRVPATLLSTLNLHKTSTQVRRLRNACNFLITLSCLAR